MAERTGYISHTCKNKDCRTAFLGKSGNICPLYAPTNKYCPNCEAKGFKSEKDPRRVERMKMINQKKLSSKQNSKSDSEVLINPLRTELDIVQVV